MIFFENNGVEISESEKYEDKADGRVKHTKNKIYDLNQNNLIINFLTKHYGDFYKKSVEDDVRRSACDVRLCGTSYSS